MDLDKTRVVDLLNRILENELAGVVRYTHYSFLVYGFSRIPIVEWLRAQARHRGDPQGLATEGEALALYKDPLRLVESRSVMLEEYARRMIYAEELHAGEVDKMLRKPGEIAATRPIAA